MATPRRRRSAAVADLAVLGALMGLATFMRLFALRSSYDASGDEVDYTSLGISIRHGTFPPQFYKNIPFLLHPPLFFAMSALWEDILRPAPTYLGLINQARDLNVVCAVISAGLIYHLGRSLAGLGAGMAAALLFIFDPFLAQINDTVLLETSTLLFVLAGWAILLRLFRPGVRRPVTLAVVGGLVAGLAFVTKDISFAVVVPPLLVAAWRRWAPRRTVVIAIISTLVPTVIYLIALIAVGSLGVWFSQETYGLQRLLGIKKITGFNEGGHPSLVHTLTRQGDLFGFSYLICGLGVLAAIYLLRRCDTTAIRVLATITMAGALTLVYATLFGTIETQMFYFPAVPALIALPVAVVVHARSHDAGSVRNFRRVLVGLLAVVLIYNGAVWVHVHTSTDNGVQRLVTWFQTKEPKPGVIADDTDVAQLVLDRYGFDAVAAGPPILSRFQKVTYMTIMSVSVDGRYGTLTPAEASFYELHGTLLYRFTEPTYGQVSVYRTDNPALW